MEDPQKYEDAEIARIVDDSVKNMHIVGLLVVKCAKFEIYRALGNEDIKKNIVGVMPYLAAAGLLSFCAKEQGRQAVEDVVIASTGGKINPQISEIFSSFRLSTNLVYMLVLYVLLELGIEINEETFRSLLQNYRIPADIRIIKDIIRDYNEARENRLSEVPELPGILLKPIYYAANVSLTSLAKTLEVAARNYLERAYEDKAIRAYALKNKRVPWFLAIEEGFTAVNEPFSIEMIEKMGRVFEENEITPEIEAALMKLGLENYWSYIGMFAYLDVSNFDIKDNDKLFSVLRVLRIHPEIKNLESMRKIFLEIKSKV